MVGPLPTEASMLLVWRGMMYAAQLRSKLRGCVPVIITPSNAPGARFLRTMFAVLAALLLGPSSAFVVSPRHRSSVSLGCPRSPVVSMQTGELTPGVGEGRNLPSPSGINMLPLPVQAAIVLGISAGIAGLAAVIAGPGFDALRGSGPWNLSRPTWPLLGFIYLAAGIAHFTEEEGFANITPPNGSWGLCAAAGRTPRLVNSHSSSYPTPAPTKPNPAACASVAVAGGRPSRRESTCCGRARPRSSAAVHACRLHALHGHCMGSASALYG